MTEIYIRHMNFSEASQCFHVHLQAFPKFILTFLGADLLSDLYSAIPCDLTGIGVIAEKQGCIGPSVTFIDVISSLQ